MHARINYVDIKPSSFLEVDEFWRTKVRDFAGLTQGYFLRDGETAHTLSFVVFDTEKSMVDNTEQQLGSIVKEATAHRLSEPELHFMEVCAHVAAHGEGSVGWARVADVTLKADRLDDVVAGWPGHVTSYKSEAGFRGAYLCCDRTTGVSKSVSFWGSEADVRSNESSGAFSATVEPYKEMIAVEPVTSYWGVRIVV